MIFDSIAWQIAAFEIRFNFHIDLSGNAVQRVETGLRTTYCIITVISNQPDNYR